MSKPASQTTLLQVVVSEPLAAGALCSIFQRAVLSRDFAHCARFRAVCALKPGDLIVIADDGEGYAPELVRVEDPRQNFHVYVRDVWRAKPTYGIVVTSIT